MRSGLFLHLILHFGNGLEYSICHVLKLFVGETVNGKVSKSAVEYLFADGAGSGYFLGIVAELLENIEAVKRSEMRNFGDALSRKLCTEGLNVSACLVGVYLKQIDPVFMLLFL